MHGDVKPGNLMIGPDGHATLIDLGFARQPGEVASVLDRSVLGSIHYLAPEISVDPQRADIRSDIYSLGVMLYQMLTGRRPFEGDHLAELARGASAAAAGRAAPLGAGGSQRHRLARASHAGQRTATPAAIAQAASASPRRLRD